MIVAFFLALRANTRLFEQIVRDKATSDLVLITKVQFDEFSKTTAVVVTRGLCITESLE